LFLASLEGGMNRALLKDPAAYEAAARQREQEGEMATVKRAEGGSAGALNELRRRAVGSPSAQKSLEKIMEGLRIQRATQSPSAAQSSSSSSQAPAQAPARDPGNGLGALAERRKQTKEQLKRENQAAKLKAAQDAEERGGLVREAKLAGTPLVELMNNFEKDSKAKQKAEAFDRKAGALGVAFDSLAKKKNAERIAQLTEELAIAKAQNKETRATQLKQHQDAMAAARNEGERASLTVAWQAEQIKEMKRILKLKEQLDKEKEKFAKGNQKEADRGAARQFQEEEVRVLEAKKKANEAELAALRAALGEDDDAMLAAAQPPPADEIMDQAMPDAQAGGVKRVRE
jgi:hypothetical protein